MRYITKWAQRDAQLFPAPAARPPKATEQQQRGDAEVGDALLAFYEQETPPWVVSSPDVALRVAVLEDAFRTLAHGPRRAKHLRGAYDDTLAWVNEEYTPNPGFSLSDICDLLGMDTDYVRAKLLALTGEEGGQIHFTSRRNITHRMQQTGYQQERLPRRRVSSRHKVQAKRRRSNP